MRHKTYQSLYEKIKTTDEMDQRIMEHVMQKEKPLAKNVKSTIQKEKTVMHNQKTTMQNMNPMIHEKEKNRTAYIGKIAAAAAIFLLALQLPSVQAAAKELFSHFTNRFIIAEGENSENIIEMEGDYLEISSKAYKKDCKLDSISEVNDITGLSLLESTEAYETQNCISYYPYVSEAGALNGIMLLDDCYAMGDLKNVSLKTSSDMTESQKISYEKGVNYSSPIGMQITIRSNQDEQVDYNNHELEYAGINWKLQEGDGISNIQLYEIPDLGVKAVLFSAESDGPVEWQLEEEGITVAMFIYEGIEYIYMGAVSQDTMMEFLNTLR